MKFAPVIFMTSLACTSFKSVHEYVNWDEFNPDAVSQEMIMMNGSSRNGDVLFGVKEILLLLTDL